MTDTEYLTRLTTLQSRLARKILFSQKRSDTYAELRALTLAKLSEET
jgi:hypothetical protein